MHRVYARGELEILTGRLLGAQGDRPGWESEPRDAPRRGPAVRRNEYGCRCYVFKARLHPDGYEMLRPDHPDEINSFIQLFHCDGGPPHLYRSSYFRKHCYRVYRILPHGRLPRKHDAVGPIKNGVRYICSLGPRRPAVIRHGLEHLGRCDDGFRAHVRKVHQPLLHHSDIFNWDLDTEVTAGDHDPV